MPLYYDGVLVANYRMDLVIDRRLIVEIKACKKLMPKHVKQVLHYVRATDSELALLLNFGIDPEVRRFTVRNSLKRRHSRLTARAVSGETTRNTGKGQE